MFFSFSSDFLCCLSLAWLVFEMSDVMYNVFVVFLSLECYKYIMWTPGRVAAIVVTVANGDLNKQHTHTPQGISREGTRVKPARKRTPTLKHSCSTGHVFLTPTNLHSC